MFAHGRREHKTGYATNLIGNAECVGALADKIQISPCYDVRYTYVL